MNDLDIGNASYDSIIHGEKQLLDFILNNDSTRKTVPNSTGVHRRFVDPTPMPLAVIPAKPVLPVTPKNYPLVPVTQSAVPAPITDQFLCAGIAAGVTAATGLSRDLVYNFCLQNASYLKTLPVKRATQFVTSSLRSFAQSFRRVKPIVTSQKVQVKTSAPMATQQTVKSGSSRMTRGKSVRLAPAARSTRINTRSKARTRQTPNGVIISHKEMIGTLVTSGTASAYAVHAYVANPGKSAMFPWLSSIAVNYDRYRFKRLSVALVSNQSTATVGKIGVGFDFDSTDDAPSDRVEFFALTYHSECSVWDSTELVIPCDNTIRFTNTHTLTDSKLIDLGQILIMADQVVATTTAVADIIVSYEIELIDAQQASYQTGAKWVGNFTSTTGADVPFVTSVGPIIPEVVATSGTVWTFTLPQGYYLVNTLVYDSAGAASPVVTAADGTNAVGFAGGEGDVTKFVHTYVVKITSAEGSFTYTISGVATWSVCEDILVMVTRIAPSVYNLASSKTNVLAAV